VSVLSNNKNKLRDGLEGHERAHYLYCAQKWAHLLFQTRRAE